MTKILIAVIKADDAYNTQWGLGACVVIFLGFCKPEYTVVTRAVNPVIQNGPKADICLC